MSLQRRETAKSVLYSVMYTTFLLGTAKQMKVFVFFAIVFVCLLGCVSSRPTCFSNETNCTKKELRSDHKRLEIEPSVNGDGGHWRSKRSAVKYHGCPTGYRWVPQVRICVPKEPDDYESLEGSNDV